MSLDEAESASGAAVVVDVMRAFTTAAWAFHRGAARIVLVGEIEEALALKATTPGMLAFCDGAPKPGFDLANSPGQLLSLDVAGRTIVQRTTSGTRRALAAKHCSPLFCTGFVCAAATANALRRAEVPSVSFVLGGGDEDWACAEHIAALLAKESPGLGFVERARRSTAAADLNDGVKRGFQGVDARDVDLCLELDRFDFAIQATAEDGRLTLSPTR